MKINRLLSTLTGITMSLLGLTAGVTIGWIPSMILSILGIGPFLLILMGLLGAGASFTVYVKCCKQLNCWPMYAPPPSLTQRALSWVSGSVTEESLYQEAKVAINALESELSLAHQQGWRNFKIEFSTETGGIFDETKETSANLLQQLSRAPAERPTTEAVVTAVSHWLPRKSKGNKGLK